MKKLWVSLLALGGIIYLFSRADYRPRLDNDSPGFSANLASLFFAPLFAPRTIFTSGQLSPEGQRLFRERGRLPISVRASASAYWARTYGSTYEDFASFALPAAGGGYFGIGMTKSFGPGSGHNKRGLISKLSNDGKLEWAKTYDTRPGNDWPLENFDYAQRANDNGFVIAGSCFLGYAQGAHPSVLKFSKDGSLEWACRYGKWGRADCIQQTRDGGFVVAGLKITPNYPQESHMDFWVCKLTALGDPEWSYTYGGPAQESDWMYNDRNITVLQTPDDGYILAGDTNSFGAGWTDIWVLKLSSTGAIEWQKTYGGKESEWFYKHGPHIQLTNDGGYLVACATLSFKVHYLELWLLKINSAGDIEWQRAIGGSGADVIQSILPTQDGGSILAGVTRASGPEDILRAWLIKLRPDSSIEWQKAYGRDGRNEIRSVGQTPDLGYIMAGCRVPTTPDPLDLLIIKAPATGEVGAAGSGFTINTSATIKETDAIPADTFVIPVPAPAAKTVIPYQVEDVTEALRSDILCWAYHQPPINLSLERQINRGLFKGEAFNVLRWEANPQNSGFTIKEYRIYRKPLTGQSPLDYAFLARVPGNIFTYTDAYLPMSEKYAYYLTAVDEDGNESARTAPVQND